MKAVLFAGGLGTRMREETDFRPKPMVEIGGLPVLWHIMKIYASYGVRDFLILAGYKAGMVKDFFYNFSNKVSDIKVNLANGSVEYLDPHLTADWDVTVLDTGEQTLTGERLLKAKPHLQGNSPFFCTYGDGLAPVNLSGLIEHHRKSEKVGTMTVTQPANRFGVVDLDAAGQVLSFREKPRMTDFVNMGFFVFNQEVFDYLEHGESLEEGCLPRLAKAGELAAFAHTAFWEPMDTFREYQELNKLWNSGNAPWKVW